VQSKSQSRVYIVITKCHALGRITPADIKASRAIPGCAEKSNGLARMNSLIETIRAETEIYLIDTGISALISDTIVAWAVEGSIMASKVVLGRERRIRLNDRVSGTERVRVSWLVPFLSLGISVKLEGRLYYPFYA
jgi:hypothetical protein